ncbi:hypothetical protein HF670_02070 [Acidithiobacillus thiooxidans]|uniref:hypothetical protein n=1 Tax=Acidithiobacillus thiooxidans TaxID=930 RepID=UPI001C078F0F|nr:hypothetical protein [Acidithiobacillus thiooxidans]MBU2838372.1 hypothetical protein [Acidithiobacillus thiooxidans]
MDWASIAEVISAIATVALAGATFWMGRQSKKSICQTKEMYEKDNIPLLVFNFYFDSDSGKVQMVPKPPENREEDKGFFCTSIDGTLVNVSNTAAVDCELSIRRIDEDGNEVQCFEKNIPIVSGLSPQESKDFTKKLIQHDQMKYTGDSIRSVSSFGQYLYCHVPPDQPCPFIIVFSYKNRFGKKFESKYQVTPPDNDYPRRAIFVGAGIIESAASGTLKKKILQSNKRKIGNE